MMNLQPISQRGERKVLLRVEGTILNTIHDVFENRGGMRLKLTMKDFLRPYMQALDARKDCTCRPLPVAYLIDISYLLTISTPQLKIVKSTENDVAHIEAEVVIPDIARVAWVNRREVVQGKFSLEMWPADPTKLGRNHLLVNENILKNEVASDFTIVARNGAEIKCHKSFILGHDIPAFRAMLENDYEESRNNTLKMDDMSEDGVRAFIKYLYVGDVSVAYKNPEIAFELLYAAQKYGVDNLKRSIVNLFERQKKSWFTGRIGIEALCLVSWND